MFETKQRDNGDSFVVFTDNASEDLKASVFDAHGDRLPDDWHFATYRSILSSMSDYDIKSIDDFEDNRAEIVDSLVDVYTSNLTSWLNQSVYNLSYLDEAINEFGNLETAFDLLQKGQYLAIDEIYGHIVELLEAENGENEGQDRESYTDDQDRKSYTIEEDV